MKELSASNLSEKVGDEVTGFFVLENLSDFQNKKGIKRAECTLSDVTGKVKCIIWDEVPSERYRSLIGQIVKVDGSVVLHDGAAQLQATSTIEIANPCDYQLEDFVKQMDDKAFASACKAFKQYISSIHSPFLRKIVEVTYTDKTLARMRSLPAGILFHHAYNGGLIDHILEVVHIADFLCGLYLKADEGDRRDIAITGALLNDIGKVKEYTPFPLSQRTNNSQYTSFIDEGSSYLSVLWKMVVDANPNMNIDDKLLLKLKHIILNCHATKGVKRPRTKEAMIVYCADMASANIHAFDTSEERYDAEHPGNLDEEFRSSFFDYTLLRDLNKCGGKK